MDTAYGLRGTISPQSYFQSHSETFQLGPLTIGVNNGVLEIGFDDEQLTELARTTVRDYLHAASLERGERFTIDLNESWGKASDGTKQIRIQLSETVTPRVSDALRIMIAPKEGDPKTVFIYDSRDLRNHTTLVEKCQRDSALASALRYFGDEVAEDDLPLYGIYKALEALTAKWGKDGREKLAALAGKSKQYVNDVMQTAQTTRHHADPHARAVLTEDECKNRARELILAYAKTIS